ncbi:hypothetical protein Hanom_Chr02g00131211 [Helianthus anomalus]
MSTTLFFLPIPNPNPNPNPISLLQLRTFPSISPILSLPQIRTFPLSLKPFPKRRDFRMFSDDGDGGGDAEGGGDDADGGGEADHEDLDEEEADEGDNKRDYDVEYEEVVGGGGGDDGITMVHSKSFVSTQGWNSEEVVDYRINEDEFHKISLMDCDFFIRKPPDPDNDVYDFREVV